MHNDLICLLNLIEDEFRHSREVRISPVFPSGTTRSIDLPQDYDPESNNTHKVCGVKVQASHKEFFFPQEWFLQKGRVLIHKQIEEIREILS